MDPKKSVAATLRLAAHILVGTMTLFAAHAVNAAVLYAATARAESSAGDNAGRLYVVNTANARWRLVGPIKVDGKCVPIDGLAVHPTTRELYGITSRELTDPMLIKIDPRTARATRVGSLGVHATDIHFDESGTLFAWIPDGNRLGIVNLESGAVNVSASTLVEEKTTAGGLAINSRGRALVAANMSRGVIEELDSGTGEVVGALALADPTMLYALYALTFSRADLLLAVNQPKPGATVRELVSIDVGSGKVKRIGALPDEVDAIAFDDRASFGAGKGALALIFVAVLVGLNAIAYYRWRPKRT